MKKRKRGIKYLRYRNLSNELALYGYEYTPRKAVFGYGLLVLAAVAAGLLYKLELPYVGVVALWGILFSTVMLLQTMKGKYHTMMFSLANNYMEQFLYSFKSKGTVLNALSETAEVFEEEEFHKILVQAIAHIQFETVSKDPEREALDMVGEFFGCEKVDVVHAFVLGAQRRGGNAEGSIALLASNRAMWADRVCSLQKEFQAVKRNIIFALAATLLICVLPLYMLGNGMDISFSPICQISAVVLIGLCMLVYIKADKRLCRNWIEKEKNTSGMGKKYEEVRDYDKGAGAKKSCRLAVIPFILFTGAVVWFKSSGLLLAGIAVILFVLNQHRIGHSLAKKKVAREIAKQFPEWLMQVALLLQTENVQIAMRRSVADAPEVLAPALGELVEGLEKAPDAKQPYLDFLKDYRNPDVQSAMRMLLSLSSGNGGNLKEQIEELIVRNNTMMDKAEKLEQEDKIAGMKIYILLPSLFASFKMMADMSLLLLLFLQKLSFGG